MEKPDFQHIIHPIEDTTLLAHIGTLDFYPRTSVLKLDRRCRELFGLSQDAPATYDALIGAVHPEDAERVHETLEAALRRSGEDRCSFECRLSGELRWVLIQARAYFDPAGNCERFVGAVTEITKQKQVEEELQSTIQARDEFLSIASHELKTPLTSLSLQIQTLSRSLRKSDPGLTPQKLEKSLNLCERQSARLSGLLDELLDLTRIRVGKLHLVYEEVNLALLAVETVEHVKAEFGGGEKNRNVEVDADPSAIGMWDRSRIEQVATNLISNAFKYGEGKPITVSVKKSPETQKLFLTVRDRGMGIVPRMHQKIFERFERAIGFSNISGLGLGLYISRQIVEAHQGTIRVESSPGLGSVFTVELPKYPH
jgi:PAS domain S-box-containing protein